MTGCTTYSTFYTLSVEIGGPTLNWTIYCIECVASVALFTGAIMIPLCRNPVWWIHDYPADILEKYFENHERIPTKTLSVPVLLKKGFALLLIRVLGVIFALVGGMLIKWAVK